MSDQHTFARHPAFLDLQDAWRVGTRPVVVWLGAGLSRPAGLPDWFGLKRKIEEEIEATIKLSNGGVASKKRALLDAAKAHPSIWKAFDLLEEALGPASFIACVTRELKEALRCNVPQAYTQLWNMNVRGVITLNIDRFATRAFALSNQAQQLMLERDGFDLRPLIGSFSNHQSRFIANLHGQLEDPTRWVFTEKRLTALLQSQHYNEFVRDCIKYCTIVFLGITASDKAIIDHFLRVGRDELKTGPHFWITDSSDADSITVAENAGIQIVPYKNARKDHSELAEMLKLIKSHNPVAAPADPVSWNAGTPARQQLPTPRDLILQSPNDLRNLLNAEASRILQSGESDAKEQFSRFCREYSRPILLASNFEPDQPDSNSVLGCQLSEMRKEGGFGKVWHAVDADGNEVAIKAFRYEIRDKPELLDAFRRGVRSMRLLERLNIPGIVKFKAASEVPPVVSMEWIDGVTLQEAMHQGGLTSWHEKVTVLNSLAEIIFSAHNAASRVLHRDIRPQNVMLRDYYVRPEDLDVVVLDFDLSWHVGALERSVYVSGGTAYLAPEQLTAQAGATTRSAAVDSYGIGMTAYFLLCGSDPVINASLKSDWSSNLQTLATRQGCKEWKSLPRRYARLIVAATDHQQARRVSFAEVVAETQKLKAALLTDASITDPSMLAEELFSRSNIISDYEMVDGWPARVHSTGLRVSASALTGSKDGFSLRIRYSQQGSERYKDHFNTIQELKTMPSPFTLTCVTDYSMYTENRDLLVAIDVATEEEGRKILAPLVKQLDTLLDRLLSKLAR